MHAYCIYLSHHVGKLQSTAAQYLYTLDGGHSLTQTTLRVLSRNSFGSIDHTSVI